MKKTLISILIWLYFTVLACFFFVVILLTYLITFPFDPNRRWPNFMLKGLAFAFIYGVPGWKVDIRGIEHLEPNTPAVYISNHQSFFDLSLYYLIPGTMKWIAKKSLFYIPILGWMIYLTGHVAIDRSRKMAFSRLTSAIPSLQAGIPIMIFPEGTRTTDGEVGRFKNGAFQLAMDQEVPIQPMVLDGGFEAQPSGSWRFNSSQQFIIQILPRVMPGNYDSVEELREDVRDRMIRTLGDIRNQPTVDVNH